MAITRRLQERFGRADRMPRWRDAVLPVVATASVLTWHGCSVERDYETLSFFFDGVPQPGALGDESAAGDRDGRELVLGPNVSVHSAYLERRCTECHGDKASFGFTTEGFSDLDEAVCLKCHQEAIELPRLHGPVAVGECLICHEPHVSRYPTLLVDDSPALCTQCHTGELEADPTTAGHADPARNCLDCHYGHGGTEQYFTRPQSEWLAETSVASPEGRAER